jgi:AcrR family transcriptional regulator
MLKKSMSLRERKKEEKLQAIERAGRELFSENGFEATTTRAIAQRAGIGAGTLFVYFPNKMDLLVHLFLKDIEEVIDEAFGSLDEELELVDALLHVFGRLYDYYERDLRLSRVFLKEIIFIWSRARDEIDDDTKGQHHQTFTELLMRLATIVQRAKERGELAEDVEALEATYHFFGAYWMGLMSRLAGAIPDRDNQQRLLARGLRALVAGLSAVEPEAD